MLETAWSPKFASRHDESIFVRRDASLTFGYRDFIAALVRLGGLHRPRHEFRLAAGPTEKNRPPTTEQTNPGL